jgi:hypothetical protein
MAGRIYRAANLLATDRAIGTKRVPSRGLTLGHGSDFASSWSILYCGGKAMSDKSARLSV